MKAAAGVLAAAFALVYLPHVGHGFIKDDFAWIYHGHLNGAQSLGNILLGSVGFYRPIVTLSFGLNEALFGTWSLGYGLFNFALAAGCGAMLYAVSRALGLTAASALFAAAVWAFNFHGINMAVLWLSGRTALLLTLFSLLTAWMVLHRRPLSAFLFALLALGSKEEAVVLPLICAVLSLTTPPLVPGWRVRLTAIARAASPALAALIVYAVLRMQSGAITPQNAPSFYRLEVGPQVFLDNVLQYFDRSATWAIAVLLLLAVYFRQVPRLSSSHPRVLWVGVMWWIAGFALTIWLPVRSSLYAVFPSIGVALIAAAIAEGLFDKAPAATRRRAAIAGIVLPLLLLPVYWSRNMRWVELADLSAATFAAISDEASTIPANTLIELRDDRSTRASFQNTFGTLYPKAAHWYFAGRHQLWIEPPPPEHADLSRPQPAASVFELRGHTVVRIQ